MYGFAEYGQFEACGILLTPSDSDEQAEQARLRFDKAIFVGHELNVQFAAVQRK